MSTKVDKHVVQMEFDNATFERKVSTTRTSIKNLKKDLTFDDNASNLSAFEKGITRITDKIKDNSDKTSQSLKSLQSSFNGIDLSKLSTNLETIASRFTTMGAAGFAAVQRITNAVIDFGKNMASSTFGQIISGGRTRALNLEQAQFQIKGLGVDWKNAETELGINLYDQIDKAVSGTAYGLDSAAKVAGQLLASNIKEGTQDMQNALSGISGVAAMTNSSYDEIGQLFTKIAGNNRLYAAELNSFAARGLNVAASLAKYYETDEATLRQMVTDGKVKFKDFAEAMNLAFGEQATKANDTYTGALSNVRAALSRIGADLQTPYLENMRKTFVALIPVLNGVRKVLNPLFKIVEQGMNYLSSFAVSTLEKLAYLGKDGLELTGLQKFLDKTQEIGDAITKTYAGGYSALSYFKKAFLSVVDIIKTIKNILSSVLTPVINSINSLFKLSYSGVDIIYVAAFKLYKLIASFKTYLQSIFVALDNALNTNDALQNVISVLILSLKGLLKILGLIIKIAGKVIKLGITILGLVMRLINPIAKFALKIYETFIASGLLYKIFRPLITSLKNLKNTIATLTSGFKTFLLSGLKPVNKESENTVSIWTKAVEVITRVLTKFVNFVASAVDKLRNYLAEHDGDVAGFAYNLGKGIRTVIDKVKEFFSSWDGIRKLFNGIVNVFKQTREGISNAIASFKTIKTDGVNEFTSNFQKSLGPFQAIGKFLVSFWELIKSIATKIAPLVKGIVTALFDTLSGVTRIIKDGVDNLVPANATSLLASGGALAFITYLLKKVEKIVDAVKKTSDNLTGFGGLKDFFKSLSTYLGQLQKNMKMDAVKTFATAVLELAIALILLASIEPTKLAAPLLVISVLIMELKALFEALDKNGPILAIGVTNVANAIVKMATSVLILSLAVKALANMDIKQMSVASVIISGLLWELVGVSNALAKSMKDEKTFIKGSGALIIMALAIKILAGSLVKLSQNDLNGILSATLAVVSLIGALAGAMYIMSKSNEGIIKASVALLIMCFAIAKLGTVIEALSNQNPIAVLAAAVAITAIIYALERILKLDEKEFNKISKSIRSIAASLIVLAIGCAIFTKVDSSGMQKAGIALGAVLAAILILAAISKFVDVKYFGKLGVAFLGLGIAMAGFAAAAKMMEWIDWADLAKAGATLAVLVAVMILLGKVKLNYTDVKGLALSMLALAAGLTAMGIALAIFTIVPILGIVKGLAALVVILGLLVAASYALKHGNVKVLKDLGLAMVFIGIGTAAMAVGIALFAASITVLATSVSAMQVLFAGILMMIIKTAPLITKAIEALIVAFCNSIKNSIPVIRDTVLELIENATKLITDYLPQIGSVLDKILEVILPLLIKWIPRIVDALVNILIKIIESLAKRTPDLVAAIGLFFKNLLGAIRDVFNVSFNEETMKGLLTGLAVFTACIVAIVIAAKFAQKALVGMLAILAVVGVITLAVFLLASIPVDQFLKITLGLSAAFLSLSACLFIISMIPLPGALMGIAGLAIFIAAMTAILAAMGELSKIEGLTWLIEEGTKLLALIGKAIGEFVGNIVGAFASSVTSYLPVVAENLSAFMEKLAPFIAGAKQFNQEVLDGVLILVGVILAFTAASLISAITSFFGGEVDFAKFGQQLCNFAPYMKQFGELVKGVDTASIEEAGKAAKALADFARAIPNSGGLLGAIVGENDMDVWAEKLPALAEGLIDFSNAISDGDGNCKINSEAVKEAGEAIVALADAASKIPNSGGILGGIVGENDVDVWGKQLPELGKGLAAFSASVDGKINEEACSAALDVISYAAEVADTIPNQGGFLAKLVGDNNIGLFGNELALFGKGLAQLSGALSYGLNGKGINWTGIAMTIRSLRMIVDIANEIPNQGGFVAFWAGDNTLSGLGEELVKYGEKLNTFSTKIASVDFKSVTIALQIISVFILMAKAINEIENFDNVSKFKDAISNISNVDFVSLGDALTDLNSTELNEFQNAVDRIQSMVDIFNSIATITGLSNVESFGTAIEQFNNSDFATLGSKLIEFSRSVDGSNGNGGISLEAIRVATEAGSMIATMMGDLWNATSSGTDTATAFEADSLVGIGEALSNFSSYVDGRNGTVALDKVKEAVDAGKKIATLFDTSINEDNFDRWLGTSDSIATKTDELEKVAKGFYYFSRWVGGASGKIDADAVEKAAKAGKEVGKMLAVNIDKEGLKTWLTGEDSLAGNGEGLKKLGQAIVGFSNIIAADYSGNTSLPIEGIRSTVDAAKLIVDLLTEPLNTANLTSWLTAIKDVDGQNSQLEQLGAAIVGFARWVGGGSEKINMDSLGLAKDAATAIKDVLDVQLDQDHLDNWISQVKDIKQDGIVSFAEAIWNFCSWISGGTNNGITIVDISRLQMAVEGAKLIASISEALPENAATGIGSFASAINELGQADVAGFLDNFQNADTEIYNAIDSFTTTFLAEFANRYNAYTNLGMAVLSVLINGFSSKKQDAYNAMNDVFTYSLSFFGTTTFYEGVFSIGMDFCNGIANGIYATTYAPVNASISAAQAIIDAARNKLDENSPSKVGFEVGKFWPVGVANGMTEYSYMVTDASNRISDEVLSYVSTVQQAVNSIDFRNVEPSVSPVVDLSRVRSGVSNIAQIMNGTASYAISSNIAKERAELNKRTNTIKVEATSKDVVEAVGDLKGEIRDLKEQMSRMKVYLDKKTMVGEMMDDIDVGLGQRAYRKSSGGVKSGHMV